MITGVREIALGPNGSYHILLHDGRQTWNGLPTDLYNKLYSRSPKLPGVSFVALGPQGEWFVKFKDGGCYWDGPTTSEFDHAVKSYNKTVEFVAFGPKKTWFVRFSDGSFYTDGLPQCQRNRILSLHRNGNNIQRLTLGNNGDWWMQFDTGHSRFFSSENDIMEKLKVTDNAVFGCNGNFALIRDSSLQYWRVSETFNDAVGYEQSDSESDNVYLDLEDIRFTQASINSNLSGGFGTIYDLANALLRGDIVVEDLPSIRVVEYNYQYWSLDNRRLWAFKHAGLHAVPVMMVLPGEEFFKKLTTCTSGWSINVN